MFKMVPNLNLNIMQEPYFYHFPYIVQRMKRLGRVMGILRHVQQYSTMHVYIVVVSFIGGENWSITEKHY
jgi:hypothetical protein